MGKRLALALVALGLLAAGLTLYLTGAAGGGREAATPVTAAEAERAVTRADLAQPDRVREETGAELALPEAERVEVPAASRREEEDPWSASRSGLRGRLVESDGTPAADFEVTLQELAPDMLFSAAAGDDPAAVPHLEVAATRTDAEGRFLLAGARREAFHALGIELGRPRGTLRMVDAVVNPGEVTDLGDVVLEPYAVISGQVLDARSRPVAGARVRAGDVMPEVVRAGAHEVRSSSLLAVVEGPLHEVLEPPAWILSVADRLPLPTTTTDREGRFRLEGVPLAELVLAVDRPGLASHTDQLDATAGGEHDLGAITLGDGRRVTGKVVDEAGRPVPCEDVYAGAMVELGEVVILQHAGPTDAEGRFELEGLPPEGDLYVAARRNPSNEWELEGPLDAGAPVTVRLPVGASLTVRTRDAAGRPVRAADLIVEPAPEAGMASFAVGAFFNVPRHTRAEDLREIEEGSVLCDGLAPGRFQVTARAPGFAPVQGVAEVGAGGGEIELVFAPGITRSFLVLDGLSREPVVGARVSLVETHWLSARPLASGTTGADGRVALGPVAAGGGDETHEGGFPDIFGEQKRLVVRVEHPGYPTGMIPEADLPLESGTGPAAGAAAGTTAAQVVELAPGGTLVGRVHEAGRPPGAPLMLSIEIQRSGISSMFEFPRLALTDADGAFRVMGLVAGDYEVNVFERFLDGDLLGRLRPDLDPQRVARVECTILPGETTTIDADLALGAVGPTGFLQGSVRVAGRPIAGASVRVDGERRRSVETDEAGRFDAGEVVASRSVDVRVEAVLETSEGVPRELELYRDAVVVQPGEVHRLDLALDLLEVDVIAVEKGTGAPIGGLEVELQGVGEGNQGLSDEAVTDERGRVRLMALHPGPYGLSMGGEEWLRYSHRVELEPAPTPQRIPVELERGVSAAGRVVLSGGGEPTGRGFSYVWVRSAGSEEGAAISASARVGRRDLEFELQGLVPGHYVAELIVAGTRGQPVEFDLGPAGADDLVLVFTPAEEE